MTISLTRKESECFVYLCAYDADQGMSPTVRDIAVAMGLKSTSGVQRLLDGLEKKRRIHRHHKLHRGIEIIEHRCPSCGHDMNSQAGSETAGGAPGGDIRSPQPRAVGGASI